MKSILGIHCHSQNLNERHDRTKGSMWRHGRAWLGKLGIEWCIPGGAPSFRFSIGDGDNLWCINLGLMLVSLYVHWSGYKEPKWAGEFKAYFHGGGFWWALWAPPWRHDCGGRQKWWRKTHCFNFADFFLGRWKHSTEVCEKGELVIPLPEGLYIAKYEKQRHTWKRPRWFARTILYVEVELEHGMLPYMGKGENGWDCGETGLISYSVQGWDLEKAIAKGVENTLNSRRKYGTPKRIKEAIAQRPILNRQAVPTTS